MKYYRVKDWETRFESAKSREYNRKAQSYMPNKCGMGYMKIMREHDGAAIYGAFCAVVAYLSRQELPRLGILTDNGKTTGRALEIEDIAMVTFVHPEQIARMLAFCGSQSIGWLIVEWRKDTIVPEQSPQLSLALPERGRPKAGVQNSIPTPSLTYDRHCPSPLPLPSPLPVPLPEILPKETNPATPFFASGSDDKYSEISDLDLEGLVSYAVKFCNESDPARSAVAWKRAIRIIGPEAFRNLLAAFVGSVESGESCNNRGAVFWKCYVKPAMEQKAGAK